MNRRTFLTYATTASALVMLSACGFHLRGSNGEANLPFRSMMLGFTDTSPLGTELKRNIRANGTLIVTDPKAAEAILEVLSETREKIVLSLNSAGRVREYTLYYKLRFRVKDNKDVELLAPTEIVLKRDISFNESAVLAKEAEEGLLYRDMQTDLVQQILRRLAALKPAV
ncbi:LPS-assembly lipoprotein [Actimicrobium sp. GrIS 1.19]|uniref:LPS-assembly lipoprotein LptE n=1 Tax=Actimicrobium sp. GrIS 1.19 TaxID=3071708 RepID=UPI002DFD9FD4|nr:LPS-assembly lipoprotein [Actimicrobium sp. GrIS 1.19]